MKELQEKLILQEDENDYEFWKEHNAWVNDYVKKHHYDDVPQEWLDRWIDHMLRGEGDDLSLYDPLPTKYGNLILNAYDSSYDAGFYETFYDIDKEFGLEPEAETFSGHGWDHCPIWLASEVECKKFYQELQKRVLNKLNGYKAEDEQDKSEEERNFEEFLKALNIDETHYFKINESLKEAIEETPEIESQDVVTIEEPSQEDVDNGMYNIISQEMRDTLQDIENLKSIITTLKANDESREDIIDGLETIIDERAIHVGMLQSMLDSFDEGTKQLIDQGRLTLEEPELVDIAKEEEVIDTNVDKLV